MGHDIELARETSFLHPVHAPARPNLATLSVVAVAGGAASLAAVVIAAALVLVFAATLALLLILSIALLGAGALALRLGRRGRSARRLGHSWIVYGLQNRI